MKSLHRRIVVGLSATALLAGGGIAAVAANASVQTAAAAPALPVRLLVGLRAGVAADVELPTLNRLGMAQASSLSDTLLEEVRVKSVSVPSDRAAAVTAALKADPNVSYVETDLVASKLDVTPNDTYFASQPELKQIKVPTAWDTTTGAKIKVAVVDTGVKVVGDLRGKVLTGRSFVKGAKTSTDDEGHGTIVASLIAAKTNNGAGIAGVCAQCEILPVKVLNSEGEGYYSDIANGIIWAAKQNAKIINLSLGGKGSAAVLRDAVAYANLRGALVVAAAGNDGKTSYTYPAAYTDVLSVGANNTRSSGGTGMASFSTHGSWVDVSAPGITAGMDLYGNYYEDDRTKYYPVQGTSFSSPLVAGVAALIASHRPTYTNYSIQRAIANSATKNSWTKYGRVDAAKALTISRDGTPPTATGFTPGANAKVRNGAAITPIGVADASGIRRVDLYVDGVWNSYDYTAPFAPVLKTPGKNGAIKVQLRITDKAGNFTWLPIRTVIADNVVPKVTVTKAPANKKKVKGTVKVYAAASDKNGISKVQLLVNGKVVATDTAAAYVFSFKVASQKKTMKVRVRAYDKAGNVKYTAIRTYYRA
ncbi:MAG TPA: S8 family serine peptidase [Actinoplanes sp.]|nr:S8 family serine peptidase [Actinoplanes sp.]